MIIRYRNTGIVKKGSPNAGGLWHFFGNFGPPEIRGFQSGKPFIPACTTIAILLLTNPYFARAQSGCFSWIADSVHLSNAGPAVVRIRITGFDSILSFQGSVQFDTAYVALDSVGQFGLPSMNSGNFNLNQRQNGWITFSWDDQTLVGITLPDTVNAFELYFHAWGNSSIQITNDPTPLEVINFSINAIPYCTTDGKIEIGSVSGSEFSAEPCDFSEAHSVTTTWHSLTQPGWQSSSSEIPQPGLYLRVLETKSGCRQADKIFIQP